MRQSLDYYVKGILQRDRIVLAQAITLIESTLTADRNLALKLIDAILKHTGKSVRIGISGAPGVGKSTFIETFGQSITGLGKKLAVLTIDPSSQRTKGSILGDKTRMAELATNPFAFIRPTAAADALGGVAHGTRETMLLCEAAGFDVILVETVGVGQSEVSVKNMTDMFILLMLAGSGDELQGIKKGIMEMADAVIITKADGDNMSRAMEAKADFQQAIHLLFSHDSGFKPKVLTASAMENRGIKETWQCVEEFLLYQRDHGVFEANRSDQNVAYFHEQFNYFLKRTIESSASLQKVQKEMETQVRNQQTSPTNAALTLFETFKESIKTIIRVSDR